jgi:TPP-dependent 2-oxoacid decarboxylase
MKLPSKCRYNISIKYGSIGWCFPASIGNAFANPSRKTICLTGDGAFQCVLQELTTAQTYNVNLTLILINNNVYQIENVLDDKKYNDLPDIDYEAMAKAMNCKSVATCTINNFKTTLKKYNSLQGFNIVVLKISDHEIDDLLENWAKLVSEYTTHYP